VRQYLINMAFAIDQFVSTILGGHPDDTVSQRLGRALLAKVELAIPFAAFVDFLAWAITGETDHCLASLTGRASVKELWNWGGDRSMIRVEDGPC
jgi:hypothetical protein